MNKLNLSWADVEQNVIDIARRIHLSGWYPDLVMGIDRGGLPVSTMLSHFLKVKHDSIKVSLRDQEAGGCESVLWAPDEVLAGKKILLVDDINDSGATQAWIKQDWASSVAGVAAEFIEQHWHINVRWASLVENEASNEHSDYYGMVVNKYENDVWVDFPWESFWKRQT